MDFEPAFATFLVSARQRCAETYDGPCPINLIAERGPRYIRIVSENGPSRAAWAFVDATNGDVLKADGWKRPAKGKRGSIYDQHNGVARAYWTSVR